jgi:hypothetical protein
MRHCHPRRNGRVNSINSCIRRQRRGVGRLGMLMAGSSMPVATPATRASGALRFAGDGLMIRDETQLTRR